MLLMWLAAAGLAALAAAGYVWLKRRDSGKLPSHLPGELIVQFVDGTEEEVMAEIHRFTAKPVAAD